MREERAQAWAVLLVALASIAFEVLLTRYFAIASFAEYGYWVISMAMAGFGFSGVVIALFRGPMVHQVRPLLFWLPVLLIPAAAAGFHFTTTNPFNPLALQNPETWRDEVWNIGRYYLALFPFFFFLLCVLLLNAGLSRFPP